MYGHCVVAREHVKQQKEEGKKEGGEEGKKVKCFMVEINYGWRTLVFVPVWSSRTDHFWIEWIFHSISTVLHFAFYGMLTAACLAFLLNDLKYRTDCENELLSSSNAVLYAVCCDRLVYQNLTIKIPTYAQHYFYHHRHAFCTAIAIEPDWEKWQTPHNNSRKYRPRHQHINQ